MELKFSRHEEKSTQREQFMQRLYMLEGLQLKITRKREKEELLSFLSPPQEEDSSPDLFLELTFLFVKTSFDVDETNSCVSPAWALVLHCAFEAHLR